MLISNQPHLLATQEFINGCNIQSEAARKQLFDWSTGINALGLWNSMVCWPMRSSQNAGGGGFVYSLGGLGRYHGTLQDNPIWQPDGSGIRKPAGSGATITLPAIDIAGIGQFSTFAVADVSTFSTNVSSFSFITQRPAFNDRSGGACTLRVSFEKRFDHASFEMVGGLRYNRSSISTITSGHHWYSGSMPSNFACHQQFDGVLNTTVIGSGTAIVNGAGGGPYAAAAGYLLGDQTPTGASQWDVTQAIAGFFNVSISTATHESLRQLYKNTLGQGLSLP